MEFGGGVNWALSRTGEEDTQLGLIRGRYVPSAAPCPVLKMSLKIKRRWPEELHKAGNGKTVNGNGNNASFKIKDVQSSSKSRRGPEHLDKHSNLLQY